MMKSVCLLSRRPDVTRVEFQRYYEARHAPLGARYLPFTRYVRNHLQDHDDIGFDTISEFWAADLAATAALMDSPVGDTLRTDERRFMDQAATRPAGSTERLLAGTPRGIEDPCREKIAVLLHRADGIPAEAFMSAVAAWGARLGEDAERVTLDAVSAWTERGFVCEAILWVWPGRDRVGFGEPPSEAVVWRRLNVRAAETSPNG